MIAAAQVHTIRPMGRIGSPASTHPGDVDGLSLCREPLTQLIGGVMTSFYDWYADLPWPVHRSLVIRTTFQNPVTGGTRPI